MKIKVTNFVLKDHFCPINQSPMLEFIHPALKEFNRMKLTVSIVSRMVKNIVNIENAITEYEKARISIAESLCERGDNEKPIMENNHYKFSEQGHKEFNEKLNELLNSEITIDIKQISESDIENLEINGTCYETLVKYGFIKEKEELPEKIKQNGQADKKEIQNA